VTEQQVQRRLAAILAADVVSYSALMERDEEGTYAEFERLKRELIEPSLARHKGRLIKTTGDGALAEFASPFAAMRCAIEIQDQVASGSSPLRLRVGLNLGDVIVGQDGDLFGDGINIAVRLEGIADPGGILISEKVYSEVEGKLDAGFEDRGEQQLKNISKPVRAYALCAGARKAPIEKLGAALPLPDKPSIAVLPFENMSGDPRAKCPCMKILVIDDHVLIREAMRGVLRELKGEAAVILEASDSGQAMRQIEQNPDVELVLLDLGLPDRDGLEMLSDLGNRYPTISVVVLSAKQDRDTVMKALDLGALGFIPKSGQREVMLSAFNLIFSGGIYIPPEILNRRELATAPRAAPAPSKAGATDLGLTERQIEVLALMMQGKSNKAISRVLDLAEPTVKIHVSAILKALKVANRTEAVIAATALGFRVHHDAR
jgi:DNA-binding NarL/FixJ family response regulator/class 3 adenylate cyclase